MSGSQPTYQVGVKRDQMVVMRDGAHMATDIYRPFGNDERFPALVAVGPHGKVFDQLQPLPTFRFLETGPIEWYVQRGYAVVHMDARGSGKSDGTFAPFDISSQRDLYDIIEWAADQPWCSGKVGMIGTSAYGVSQWLAAAQQPPRLACIAPCNAFVDPYRDLLYHGGIPCEYQMWWTFDVRARRLLDYTDRHFGTRHLGEGLARKLVRDSSSPLQQAGVQALVKARRLAHSIKPGVMSHDNVYWMLTNPLDGPLYWIPAAYNKLDKVKAPVYSIGNFASWGLHLRGNVLGYEMVNSHKKLLLSGRVGTPDSWPLLDAPEFGEDAFTLYHSTAFHEELLRWYDYWLKGINTGILDEPPVKYWVGGQGEYVTAPSWPLPGTDLKRLYLHLGPSGAMQSLNDGALSFAEPKGEENPTRLRYPHPGWNGMPGLGTAALSAAGVPDRSSRILTFSSEPLGREMRVVGWASLKLFAASDQIDTDFFVRLCDQPPLSEEDAAMVRRLGLQPPARVVSRGWLRASHRLLDSSRSQPARPWHKHEQGGPLEPGKIYEFDIELWPLCWLFHRGHRVRLELAPGDSSYFDGPFFHYYGVKTGTDTFYHDAQRPSHLLLPVAP